MEGHGVVHTTHDLMQHSVRQDCKLGLFEEGHRNPTMIDIRCTGLVAYYQDSTALESRPPAFERDIHVAFRASW